MILISRNRYRVPLFAALAGLWIAVPARAGLTGGAGVNFTGGSDNYRSSGIDLHLGITPEVTLGAAFSRYSNDFSSGPVPSFKFSARAATEQYFGGVFVSHTAAKDTPASTLGGDFNYRFGPPNFRTTLGLAPSVTWHKVEVLRRSGQLERHPVRQNTLEFRISERFYRKNEVQLSFSRSFYPSGLERFVSRVNQSQIRAFGILPEAIFGFPKSVVALGLSRDFDLWVPGYIFLDLDRIDFLEPGIHANSATLGGGVTLWERVDVGLTHNVYKQSDAADSSNYTGFSIGFFW